jgi:hypothetical protein
VRGWVRVEKQAFVWPTRIEENRDTCRDTVIPWPEILAIDCRNTKLRCQPLDGDVRPKIKTIVPHMP